MKSRRSLSLAGGVLVVAGAALVIFAMRRDGPNDLPSADWREFRSAFISRDGRVIDTGNGGISHSEGQGYGMLFAHAYSDRRTFEKLWQWTRTNLQTRPNDKLLSWQWSDNGGNGRVTDANNACDGDILVAWALTRAAKTWGVFGYTQSALEILADLRRLALVEASGSTFLLPGVEGFRKEEGFILNPSYYVFTALRELDAAFPGAGWGELSAPGRELLSQSRFGKWQLTPDWVFRADNGIVAIAPGFPPDFSYNAVRIPLYIAWEDPDSPLLAPFAEFWKKPSEGGALPASVNLQTDAFGPHPALPGMLAIAKLTQACVAKTPITLSDIPPVKRSEDYYSACLKILVKMAILESRKNLSGGQES